MVIYMFNIIISFIIVSTIDSENVCNEKYYDLVASMCLCLRMLNCPLRMRWCRRGDRRRDCGGALPFQPQPQVVWQIGKVSGNM